MAKILEKQVSTWTLTSRVVSLLRHDKWIVTGLAAMIVIASGLEIGIPFLTRSLIDTIIRSLQLSQSRSVQTLLLCGAAIFAATVAIRMLRCFYNYQLFRIVARGEDRVKNAAFANFLHLDASYHTQVNTGEVIGSLDRGGTAIYVVLYEILGQNLFPPLIVFCGVVASLLSKNPWIALAVVLPLPIYIGIVSRAGRRLHQMEQEVTTAFEKVSKESYDVASNVGVVKKFSGEHREAATQSRLLKDARARQFRAERFWIFIDNTQTWIATLGRVIVITLAGYLVITRKCSVGEFVLFIALQDMVYGPISQLSVLLPKLRRNLSRCERLFEILDEKTSIADRPGAAALPALRHSVEFRNLSFRYAGSDRWTLNDVNFVVPAGSTVALIGRSGTGKSTLVNLLQRCYDPQHGSVLIDGIDIRDVTQKSLRGQIAVVPQEVDLFSRTIFENISYGRPAADALEVEAAARIAQAHTFIARSGDGYETQIGERGLKLSGGERQRLGIARAILRDPSILILDEATSHLDTESERLIQDAADRITHGRTCFVIAHRLSTIQNADFVIVFADEGIEAVGTHDDLWETSPTYRRLYGLEPTPDEAQSMLLTSP